MTIYPATRDEPEDIVLDKSEIDMAVADRAEGYLKAAHRDRAKAMDLLEYCDSTADVLADLFGAVHVARQPGALMRDIGREYLIERWDRLVGQIALDRAESERDDIEREYIAERRYL